MRVFDNQQIKIFDIDFVANSTQFDEFRECLRQRKSQIEYFNPNHEVTEPEFKILQSEFGGRHQFRQMRYVDDESMDFAFEELLELCAQQPDWNSYYESSITY